MHFIFEEENKIFSRVSDSCIYKLRDLRQLKRKNYRGTAGTIF